jgi:hypothetical protein
MPELNDKKMSAGRLIERRTVLSGWGTALAGLACWKFASGHSLFASSHPKVRGAPAGEDRCPAGRAL